MSKANRNRLRRLHATLGSVPLPRAVLQAAFDAFCTRGELPDDMRLGYAVIQRAKRGYDCVYDEHGNMDWPASIEAARHAGDRPRDPLMHELYNEAVFGSSTVREAARMSLRAFAGAGLDPSRPLLLGMEDSIPGWGGVGIHLIGLPQRLARPPYEAQAARLFARCETLRDLVPQRDTGWKDEFGRATQLFHEVGELPRDDLLLRAVLVDVEVRCLMRHWAGEDVAEVMAVLDLVARSDGEARDAHLAELVAMAEAGHLLAAR